MHPIKSLKHPRMQCNADTPCSLCQLFILALQMPSLFALQNSVSEYHVVSGPVSLALLGTGGVGFGGVSLGVIISNVQ